MTNSKQLTHDPEKLLMQLTDGVITFAPALPFKRKGFYADMALVTEKGSVKIKAESYDLASGEEVFYLNLDVFVQETYWVDKEGNSAWSSRVQDKSSWKAVDLAELIRKTGAASLLEANRRIHLYRDPAQTHNEPHGILESAKALRISNMSEDEHLVISATEVFPCSIEIALDRLRAGELLHGLEETAFQSTRQV